MTEPKKQKRRRGRGEGSIFQRDDGRWSATISLGTDANGKRQRRTIYGATKSDVTKELTRLQNQKLSGTHRPVSKLTVAEFLTQWLDTSAALRVRRTTLVNYRLNIDRHVVPVVGSVPLEKLTPMQVMGIYSTMAGKGLSARTQQLVHTILRRALKMAVKWGLCIRNVCDAVDRPAATRHEAGFLNAEQAGKLLHAARGDRLEALYVVALTTGMRQGELFGLEWQDIDLSAGTLSVRRAMKYCQGEFFVEEPKTAKSRRNVMLPAMAVEALHDHRRRMMAEGRAGDVRVFSQPDGTPLSWDFIRRKSLQPLLKDAGLPPVRFHDLRHSHASLLFAAGTHPRVVQERLGHSTVGITLDIYSHCLPTMQTEAASKMDAMFKPKIG